MRSIATLILASALFCGTAWATDAAPPLASEGAPLNYYVARLHLDAPDDMTPAQGQTLLDHIRSLTDLYDKGVLFMAGPFESGKDGLEIVQAHSLEEARGYIDSDPSVKSGLMQLVSLDMWWAAYSRPENRRFTPEEMMQMMAPPPAKSSRAPRPDGGVLTLADLPNDVMPPEQPAGPPDGSLVHFELPAKDFKTVQDFYGKVFGWQFQSMGDEYLLFQTPGGEGGGFTKDYAPGDGGGTFYIYAADVAPKLAEIKAAGGTVVLDTMGIPGYGWIALFKDPQGNRVGLFSAKNPPAGQSPVPAMPKS